MALGRRGLSQRDGLVKVALDKVALAVEQGQVELRRGVAEIGRLLQPFGRLLAVGLQPQALDIQGADEEHGARIAQFGRRHSTVKAALERALYALTGEEQLAELKDGRGQAGLCGLAQGGQRRAVVAALPCGNALVIEGVCLRLRDLEGGLGMVGLGRLLFDLVEHGVDLGHLGLGIRVAKLLGLLEQVERLIVLLRLELVHRVLIERPGLLCAFFLFSLFRITKRPNHVFLPPHSGGRWLSAYHFTTRPPFPQENPAVFFQSACFCAPCRPAAPVFPLFRPGRRAPRPLFAFYLNFGRPIWRSRRLIPLANAALFGYSIVI